MPYIILIKYHIIIGLKKKKKKLYTDIIFRLRICVEYIILKVHIISIISKMRLELFNV
jgi:hypothetical protein